MQLQKKQISPFINKQRAPVIRTEGPLCEKDEQGESIERTKLLQKEAMEKWELLKRSR